LRKKWLEMSVLASIFRDHWDVCGEAVLGRLPPGVYKAAREVVPKILRCKTEASGFASLRCECGHTEKVPFTCKGRFCPICGPAAAARAAEAVKGRLLNVTHRHMVFTIPEELRWLFFRDRKLLKLLSDAAAQTLLEVVDQRCRARRVLPGIMCTVQTFGRALNFHPHVHVLVTAGGLQGTRVWQPVPFFPALSVCRKFQYHLLKVLRKKFRGDEKVLKLLRRCFDRYPKGFRVNVMSQYPNAAMAASYCCRYTGRPPISESRLADYEGQQVTYWYDDYRTGERLQVTVSAQEFLFRLLQHLPPKYSRTVRYYGLYARRVRRPLFDVVEQVSQYDYTVPRKPSPILSWRERLLTYFQRDPYRCPQCGARMELVAWCYPSRRSADETNYWRGRTKQERQADRGQLSLRFV